MSKKTYVCEIHEKEMSVGQACPDCMAERAALPNVEDMTPAERAAECRMWLYDREQLTVDWEMFVARVDALTGRHAFTHEFAYNRDGLIAEAGETRAHPEFVDEITDCLPKTIKVINFDLDPAQPDSSMN